MKPERGGPCVQPYVTEKSAERMIVASSNCLSSAYRKHIISSKSLHAYCVLRLNLDLILGQSKRNASRSTLLHAASGPAHRGERTSTSGR